MKKNIKIKKVYMYIDSIYIIKGIDMKEKKDKKMVIVVQKSLYLRFKEKCENNYKSMSEILRDSMIRYIEGKDA